MCKLNCISYSKLIDRGMKSILLILWTTDNCWQLIVFNTVMVTMEVLWFEGNLHFHRASLIANISSKPRKVVLSALLQSFQDCNLVHFNSTKNRIETIGILFSTQSLALASNYSEIIMEPLCNWYGILAEVRWCMWSVDCNQLRLVTEF